MSAGVLNLVDELAIEQGSPYALVITITDDPDTVDQAVRNLTGVTIKAVVRNNYFSAPTIFAVTVTAPTTGVLIISLTAKQTRALTYTKGVWDLMLDDTRFLAGSVEISRQVSHPL